MGSVWEEDTRIAQQHARSLTRVPMSILLLFGLVGCVDLSVSSSALKDTCLDSICNFDLRSAAELELFLDPCDNGRALVRLEEGTSLQATSSSLVKCD